MQQKEIQREKKLNLEIDSFYNNNDSSIKSHRVNTTYVKNDKKDSFYENLNTERISNSINKETKNFNNKLNIVYKKKKIFLFHAVKIIFVDPEIVMQKVYVIKYQRIKNEKRIINQ